MLDSGGGSGSGLPTTSAGPQKLRIEPAAIPGARDAFRKAAADVEVMAAELDGLLVSAWAGDPVSSETAKRFAERTNGGDAQAALDALRKYGDQLKKSENALTAAYNSYVEVEGTNTALWKGKPVDA